jgi:hypothetical protein
MCCLAGGVGKIVCTIALLGSGSQVAGEEVLACGGKEELAVQFEFAHLVSSIIALSDGRNDRGEPGGCLP